MTENNTECYVVGGAIRDILLGRAAKDVDHVVVGATPQDMLAQGFTQVGADFPVFLSPEDKSEWALARTERKTGDGYHGFETDYNPNVTLEDDVLRRDLTINALAVRYTDWPKFRVTRDASLVIDHVGGLDDLKSRTIKHISDAFCDDPVRILRVARFMARYNLEFNFNIAPETYNMMCGMVLDGEVDHLVPERVWAETEKAMMENSPDDYFDVLFVTGTLDRIMPRFAELEFYGSEGMLSAAMCGMDLEHRMMILTSTINFDGLETQLQDVKVPSSIIKSCLRFNKFVSMLLKCNCSYDMVKPNTIFNIIDTLQGWNHVAEFQRMGVALSMFNDSNLSRLFNVLMGALLYAGTIKFADLTDEQKEILEGQDISIAINRMRLDKIYEVV